MSDDKKLPAGMQMMLNMAVKALGIDPNALITQAGELKIKVEEGLTDFDERLMRLEKLLYSIDEKLNTRLPPLSVKQLENET